MESNPSEGNPPEPNPPAEMMDQSSNPPVTAGEVSELDFTAETKWPKVIGVISLIYAIIGLSCMSLSSVFMAVLPLIPPIFRGGVEMPPFIRFTGLAQSVLLVIVGIIMLTGAVGLLRRRQSAVAKLKLWAVLRLVLIVLSIVIFVLTTPAQIQMARDQLEFRNDLLREQGQTDRIISRTDEQLWRSTAIRTGIMTGLQAIYPFFLGFYLSRKKVTDEIAEWDGQAQVI
ncbi:MAG: hypothetical protein JSV91_05355 [Phycisphaerales bacterium]|nr:MAG: hypothetical protein JSV91_05355 [Phycisphaerales bacterium]